MANIIGTIVNVMDFLCRDEKKITIQDAMNSPEAFTLSAGRQYHIPAFQREIRWEKENLNILVQDIKSTNKFLGNVILSQRGDKDFDIIDGQQRISVLLMLIYYIKVQWGDSLSEAKQFKACTLKIDSFGAYEIFQKNNYEISLLSYTEKCSDKYKQARRYKQLWDSLKDMLDNKDRNYIRELLTNIKRCTLNVILAERDNTGYNIEYFIDVNLKGVRLDVEDIFKGYLFHMNNSNETLEHWINLKQVVMAYNETAAGILKEPEGIYPLVKTLYHYFNCDLYLKNENAALKFGADFYLKGDFKSSGGQFYKGEHVIKVINDDAYINESLNYLRKIIAIINDIIIGNEPSTDFVKLFIADGGDLSVDNDTIAIIKGLAKLLLLNKDITLPYALIMKYFLEIVKSGNKIDHEYADKFYAIYAFSVLFGLFSNKKELSEIEQILHSDQWYAVLIEKMKSYFSKGKILERKVLFQSKYLPENDDEVNMHKCKSLAILYNFFQIKDGCAKKIRGTSNELKAFLTNKDLFSVEHFIINDSKSCTSINEKDTYYYDSDIKKYANSIFNFIFIPDKLNGNVLKNHYINYKLQLIKEHINEIKCDYTKMVITTIDGKFIDLPMTTDNKIDNDKANEYFGYTFRRQFFEVAKEIVQNIIMHVSGEGK